MGSAPRDRLHQLAAIVEFSEDAIIGKDMDGTITEWNRGAKQLYGYSADEVIGKPVSILIPPEGSDDFSEIMDKLKRGESVARSETVRQKKGGGRVDVSLSVFPIRDEAGKIIGAAAIARDISERKRYEAALRESEKRFRLVADTAPVLIWMSGIDKLCSYFNKPWLDFTGRPLADELGNGWAIGVHPDDLQRCFDTYTQSFDQREKFRMEYRLRRHDGEFRWVLDVGVPRFNDDHSFAGYIGIAIDVTDRKVEEQRRHEMNRELQQHAAFLQSREELLKIFVKNVPAGVAMLDRNMRYLQVSDRWCADYSADSSQILGRSHYELFPDIPEHWREVHRRGLEGETSRADEERWDRKNGSTLWVRWEIRPWKRSDGVIGGILIFAEDITRRKQMEETLSTMSRKLIQSQEQERARIGRELHDDINQRIAMLAVELEHLQDNPAEVQTRLPELRAQTMELSNDVQAMSHDLHSSKLEYLGVVAGMKSWCREFSERQAMEIDFKSDISSVVPLDVGICLFRVLQEALNNALKHSGVKRIEVQLREESGEIHITIRDLGKGFDLEAVRQGRGLGLTSMQERVRLVNGTITIESKPMGGTTIHVQVPVELGHEAQRAAG
jgi:PAS domain S-box-containing protein